MCNASKPKVLIPNRLSRIAEVLKSFFLIHEQVKSFQCSSFFDNAKTNAWSIYRFSAQNQWAVILWPMLFQIRFNSKHRLSAKWTDTFCKTEHKIIKISKYQNIDDSIAAYRSHRNNSYIFIYYEFKKYYVGIV